MDFVLSVQLVNTQLLVLYQLALSVLLVHSHLHQEQVLVLAVVSIRMQLLLLHLALLVLLVNLLLQDLAHALLVLLELIWTKMEFVVLVWALLILQQLVVPYSILLIPGMQLHCLTNFASTNLYSVYSNAGYGLVGTTCTACSSGTFSPQGSSSACSPCPSGQTSGSNAATCTGCSINMFASNGACAACSSGQVAAAGSASCMTCSAGTYASTTGSCLSCLTTGVATCGPSMSTPNTW